MNKESVLQTLREQYAQATDQAVKDRIVFMANELKAGKGFGSVEKGGCGLCYTCFIREARPDKWNCEKCAENLEGVHKVRNIPMLQSKIASWKFHEEELKQDIPTSSTLTTQEIKEIFS